MKAETLKFMRETEKDLKSVLTRRHEDLEYLKKQRHCINKKVEEVTKRLIARIKELQTETITNFEMQSEKLVRDITNDITTLHTSLQNLRLHKNKIEYSECISDSLIFLHNKVGKSESMKAREQYEIMKKRNATSIDFDVNTNIESYLKEVDSLGNISNTRESKATLIGEFDIGLQSEKKNTNIYGVCVLDNNEIILADNSNLKLKRISTEYQVLDWLDLGATPYGICKTGHSEVAVTLPWLHKIQFVSIGRKMVVNWAFNIDGICRGIYCHNGDLYICCNGSGSDDPGHVIVSDMAGCLLKTFSVNKDGEYLFTSPQNVCFAEHDMYVHVADLDKGIVTVDRNGRFISSASDTRLSNTLDICIGDRSQIFVCGFSSNNVIQVGRHDKMFHEILGKTDLPIRPLTVSFVRKPSRLLITSEGSNVLKVFKLG